MITSPPNHYKRPVTITIASNNNDSTFATPQKIAIVILNKVILKHHSDGKMMEDMKKYIS